MKFLHIKKTYTPRPGMSCAEVLHATLQNDYPDYRVVAVIPLMLSYYTDGPRRYEVTEIEVLLEMKEP